MTIYTKLIQVTLISMVCCHCNYNNKIKLQPKIEPYYLSKYEDMKNVNSKNNLITSVVKDSSNRAYKMNELSKDHISVIKLWATWCTPCIKSMPEFVRLQHQYKKNKKLQFYTISIDYEYEDWKNVINKEGWKVNHFWAGNNEKSQIYHLTYEVLDSMVLSTLPNYIIINEKGMIQENLITDENLDIHLKGILKRINKNINTYHFELLF